VIWSIKKGPHIPNDPTKLLVFSFHVC
jgi:hypothetical protein